MTMAGNNKPQVSVHEIINLKGNELVKEQLFEYAASYPDTKQAIPRAYYTVLSRLFAAEANKQDPPVKLSSTVEIPSRPGKKYKVTQFLEDGKYELTELGGTVKVIRKVITTKDKFTVLSEPVKIHKTKTTHKNDILNQVDLRTLNLDENDITPQDIDDMPEDGLSDLEV